GLSGQDRGLTLTFGARDVGLALRLRRCDHVGLQRGLCLLGAALLDLDAGLHPGGLGLFGGDADVLLGAGIGQRAGLVGLGVLGLGLGAQARQFHIAALVGG